MWLWNIVTIKVQRFQWIIMCKCWYSDSRPTVNKLQNSTRVVCNKIQRVFDRNGNSDIELALLDFSIKSWLNRLSLQNTSSPNHLWKRWRKSSHPVFQRHRLMNGSYVSMKLSINGSGYTPIFPIFVYIPNCEMSHAKKRRPMKLVYWYRA
jgi:hypothetical protein